MTTPSGIPGAQPSDVQRRLISGIRDALVPVLTWGSWAQIQEDHKKVGLAWRNDLEPGWGKPKYVERVLNDLQDGEIVPVARRAVERFPERCGFALENALLWLDANGIQRVSEVTRLGLAKAFDGRRLHPSESVSDVLGRFARVGASQRFEYAEDGQIYVVETDVFALLSGKTASNTRMRSSHLAALDDFVNGAIWTVDGGLTQSKGAIGALAGPECLDSAARDDRPPAFA